MQTPQQLEDLTEKNSKGFDEAQKRVSATTFAKTCIEVFNSPVEIWDIDIEYSVDDLERWKALRAANANHFDSVRMSMTFASKGTINKFREFVQLLCEDNAVIAMGGGQELPIPEKKALSMDEEKTPPDASNEFAGPQPYSYHWDIKGQFARLLKLEGCDNIEFGTYDPDLGIISINQAVLIAWNPFFVLIERINRETE